MAKKHLSLLSLLELFYYYSYYGVLLSHIMHVKNAIFNFGENIILKTPAQKNVQNRHIQVSDQH